MKNIVLFEEGRGASLDEKRLVPVNGAGRLFFGGMGNPSFIPVSSGFTALDMLPATAATAGRDGLILTLGTGTEAIARSVTGGINLKTQASTPADNDNALLVPLSSTNAMCVPITAVSRPRFRTVVKLSQITELVFGAGLDENVTSPIGSVTAGDGAQFLFDPAREDTNVTAAMAPNWVAHMKVAGVDTYINTGVPVLANAYYSLTIMWGADKIPLYYINGVLVATGGTANTGVANVDAVIGVQINAASPAGQKDFDCLFVAVERFNG